MSHLEIIDLIAGIIFIFFLLSLICNSVFEVVSALMGLRSKMLKAWLIKTFTEEGAGHFINNALLDGTSKENKTSSYIKAADFSLALIQLIGKNSPAETYTPADTLEKVEQALGSKNNTLIPEDIKAALLALVVKAKTAPTISNEWEEKEKERFRAFVSYTENWYDNMMERLTGSYKRQSMLVIFIVASVVTIACNVNTIAIAQYLYSDKEATAKLAQVAYEEVEKGDYKQDVKSYADIMEGAADTMNTDVDDYSQLQLASQVDSTISKVEDEAGKIKEIYSVLGDHIPLGWKNQDFSLDLIPGWLLTIFAVMLGAPFWYDVLG
jgi:hypothetical protein